MFWAVGTGWIGSSARLVSFEIGVSALPSLTSVIRARHDGLSHASGASVIPFRDCSGVPSRGSVWLVTQKEGTLLNSIELVDRAHRGVERAVVRGSHGHGP